MPDYAGNIPDGGFALQPLSARSREEREHPMRYLPELHITLGKDDKSAGLTITVWTGTGGQYPGYRTLYAVRWRDAAQSTQEALEICYRGVAAALAELYDLDVTQ